VLRLISEKTSRLFVVIAVTATAFFSTLLEFQGAGYSFVSVENIRQVEDARALVEKGKLPSVGPAGSLRVHHPPGMSYIFAPGILLKQRLGLIGFPGMLAVSLIGCAGLYLLAREVVGRGYSFGITFIYAFTPIGLLNNASVWGCVPGAISTWAVLSCVRWASRGDARYLALALVVLSFGLLIKLEALPLIVMIPVAYLVFRPPLKTVWLIPSLVVCFAMWVPYLAFQNKRGWTDVRHMFSRTPLLHENPKSIWENPEAQMERVSMETKPKTFQDSKNKGGFQFLKEGWIGCVAGYCPDNILWIVVSSYRKSFYTGSFWFFCCTLMGALCLLSPRQMGIRLVKRWLSKDSKILKEIQEKSQHPLGVDISEALEKWSHLFLSEKRERAATVLSLCVMVSWAVLFLLATGDKIRYWQIWPLQCLLIFIWLPPVSSWLKWNRVGRIAQGFLMMLSLMMVYPLISPKIKHWREEGWMGKKSEAYEIVEYLGDYAQKRGVKTLNIGYQIFIYEWIPLHTIADNTYSVGAEFDYMLKHLYQIKNEAATPEGFSEKDRIRIVQKAPLSDDVNWRFKMDLNGYRTIKTGKNYSVLEKTGDKTHVGNL